MSVNDVKSAKRVLEILQFFAAAKAPASLSQVSVALGFPKPSCLALLATLEANGYAFQINGRYYLTRRWLNESQAVSAHDQLVLRLRPVLEQLRTRLGETLILAQRAGDRALYLDVAEAQQVVRFSAHAGQSKPLHASASGRALLGLMPLAERQAFVARLTLDAYTDVTPTSAEALLRSVAAGNRRGWHVNRGEHQADTLSVAAPLLLHGMPLALVVGAPMGRAAARAEEIGQALAAAARAFASPAGAATNAETTEEQT